MNCCSGTAANIVKSNKTIKNGFETWRLLYQHYSTRNTAKARILQNEVNSFEIPDQLQDFLAKLIEWEAKITEYETASKVLMTDEHKLSTMINKGPEQIRDHLLLNPQINRWADVHSLIVNFVKAKTEKDELTARKAKDTLALVEQDIAKAGGLDYCTEATINAYHSAYRTVYGKGKGKGKGHWQAGKSNYHYGQGNNHFHRKGNWHSKGKEGKGHWSQDQQKGNYHSKGYYNSKGKGKGKTKGKYGKSK